MGPPAGRETAYPRNLQVVSWCQPDNGAIEELPVICQASAGAMVVGFDARERRAPGRPGADAPLSLPWPLVRFFECRLSP
jgi:hypothetical protein